MLRVVSKKFLRGGGGLDATSSIHQNIERCLVQQRKLSSSATTRNNTRYFSTAPNLKHETNNNNNNKEDGTSTIPKQPFVTAHLEPGEWDHHRRDPYFRPKPHLRSKLISAEDFANRAPVAFDGDFESYSDGMISLSWLDSKTSRQIYQLYLDMMILSQEKHQKTSHEYVVRVIAQKHNITTQRAAGVVQLQHAEEQMRRHSPELLCDEEAKIAEDRILQNIQDAYRAEEKSDPPREFIEDPVGIAGMGEPDESSLGYTNADDLYDMDRKLEQANVRDAKHARLLIDGHIYKEDVDESTILVKADAAAKRLLKAQQKIKQQGEVDGTDNNEAVNIPYPETNAEGKKRERFQFVAKVVNTRTMKKYNKGRKGKGGGSRRRGGGISNSYTNNNTSNTLVEHDGELRIATVTEAKQTAWKPIRHKSNEYIFEGAKHAWLEKMNGKQDVWGKMPITSASAATKTPSTEPPAAVTSVDIHAGEEVEAKDETLETKDADDVDSSSSSSSDEEEESTGKESEGSEEDESEDDSTKIK